MSAWMKSALMIFFLSMAHTAYAQTFPYEAQFRRLMGEPKEMVSAFIMYPWQDNVQVSLAELSNVPHGNVIRIASVERPASGYNRWSHWESADHTVWVDLLDFPLRDTATELLGSAGQTHSGYHWENQLLLFTNFCDADKDALGAALLGHSGQLLNVGIKLKMAVCVTGTVTQADLQNLDSAISRLQRLLLAIARQVLEPAFVTFEPKISLKPEAARLLRMEGFSRLWAEVKYSFVYLEKRPQLDWDSVLERFMPRIAAAKNDVEYGRILEEVVALLRDGHTNVYPTAVDPEDEPLIRLEPIQGKPVAVAVGNLPALSPVKPGMELLEIDHTPVRTVITRDLDPYIASSTAQDRALREMRMLLKGQPGSSLHTKWLDLHGKITELVLIRDASKNRAALPSETWLPFEYKELPGRISYMALNDFSNEKIVGDFVSQLEKALQSKAWILDLRENGGGTSSIGYRILGHFLNEPGQGEAWRTRLYNPTFRAWKQPQPWYEGAPDVIKLADGSRYSRPVYVLISARTCSAAEDFLIPLKVQKRATLVGEASCGSSGQPLFFSIYGADVRICTKWDRFPDGTEFVGVGVLPDVEVSRTKEDVASGRDAVLNAAIQLASR
jgi:C-terminal processing protease CtpA/Prc